jgi:hypothetical protein
MSRACCRIVSRAYPIAGKWLTSREPTSPNLETNPAFIRFSLNNGLSLFG